MPDFLKLVRANCKIREHGECGRWGEERRAGGATFVVVMQATDVRDSNDRAESRWLHSPRDGASLFRLISRNPEPGRVFPVN